MPAPRGGPGRVFLVHQSPITACLEKHPIRMLPALFKFLNFLAPFFGTFPLRKLIWEKIVPPSSILSAILNIPDPYYALPSSKCVLRGYLHPMSKSRKGLPLRFQMPNAHMHLTRELPNSCSQHIRPLRTLSSQPSHTP